MYLIFDIETTGLLNTKKFNVYPDFRDNQQYDAARIVQIAWVVLDKNYKTIEQKSYIIKRDNFEINNSSFHGITNEISDIAGVFFHIVMFDFLEALRKSQMIISHNILFDYNVLRNHLYRFDLRIIHEELIRKVTFCTSIESTNVLKLPMVNGANHYKFPSLQELYTFYFNKKIINAHDALIDTIACAECFVSLIQDIRFQLRS